MGKRWGCSDESRLMEADTPVDWLVPGECFKCHVLTVKLHEIVAVDQ